MNKTNIIDIAHDLLSKYLNKNQIIVDATCGNGHDTFFVAPKVKCVHAFDIQASAIEHSQALNKNYQNIFYHHTSHENITKIIDHYDGILFNLGYLPKGDKEITTNHITTIQTLKNLHRNQKGFVLIVAYPGHKEGIIEQVAVQSFLDKSDIKYEVLRLPHFTKKDAPIIYFYRYI
jgi:SAM-dependent methyltransferase